MERSAIPDRESEVWLVLPLAADWRWMRDPERTPWYPAMRLFRQQKLGDWAEVIERVRRAAGDGEE